MLLFIFLFKSIALWHLGNRGWLKGLAVSKHFRHHYRNNHNHLLVLKGLATQPLRANQCHTDFGKILCTSSKIFKQLIIPTNTQIDIIGFAYMWDVYIDVCSVVFILMSLGFFVDYSSHVAHKFLVTEGKLHMYLIGIAIQNIILTHLFIMQNKSAAYMLVPFTWNPGKYEVH